MGAPWLDPPNKPKNILGFNGGRRQGGGVPGGRVVGVGWGEGIGMGGRHLLRVRVHLGQVLTLTPTLR